MFLMSAIEKIVPQSQFTVRASHIAIGAPAEFAVIGISARDLRLGLALGGAPLPWLRALARERHPPACRGR